MELSSDTQSRVRVAQYHVLIPATGVDGRTSRRAFFDRNEEA